MNVLLDERLRFIAKCFIVICIFPGVCIAQVKWELRKITHDQGNEFIALLYPKKYVRRFRPSRNKTRSQFRIRGYVGRDGVLEILRVYDAEVVSRKSNVSVLFYRLFEVNTRVPSHKYGFAFIEDKIVLTRIESEPIYFNPNKEANFEGDKRSIFFDRNVSADFLSLNEALPLAIRLSYYFHLKDDRRSDVIKRRDIIYQMIRGKMSALLDETDEVYLDGSRNVISWDIANYDEAGWGILEKSVRTTAGIKVAVYGIRGKKYIPIDFLSRSLDVEGVSEKRSMDVHDGGGVPLP